MTTKKTSDSDLIAKYKIEAAARRKSGNQKASAKAAMAIQAKDGLITVRFEQDAEPISKLGGVAKVLGRSRINIPEFKLRRG